MPAPALSCRPALSLVDLPHVRRVDEIAVTGAVVAGLILGLVEGFSAGYGFSAWTDAYSFALMILVLLVRPQGLLGGTSGPKMA